MSEDLELQPLSGGSTVFINNRGTASSAPRTAVAETAAPIGGPPPLPQLDTPYAIQELSVFGIIAQAFTLLIRRFATLLGIAAVITVPVQLLFMLGLFGAMLIPALAPAASKFGLLVLVVGGAAAYVLIMACLVTPLVQGATIHAIASEYLGVPAGAFQAISAGMLWLGPLLWAGFLGTLLTLLGYVCLILPGIYLSICFWFASCCVVLENQRGMTALQRSGELMSGNFDTAIGLGVLIFIARLVLEGLAHLVPGAALRTLSVFAADICVNLFSAAATVVFYFSCRCQRGRFDLVELAESVQAASEN